MNLGRFFQRLALYRASRRVPLWVLVALSVGFYLLAGIGKAHAATVTSPACPTTSSCTISEAYAAVAAMGNASTCPLFGLSESYSIWAGWSGDYSETGTVVSRNGRCKTSAGSYSGHNTIRALHSGVQCANPEATYDPTTHLCSDPGPTPEECLNRNDAIYNDAVMSGMLTAQCVQGCKVGHMPGEDHKEVMYSSGTGSASILFGRVGFTGETCTGETPPPDFTAPEVCSDVAGQTVCATPDGKHCYSLKPGVATKHCWTPGSTGEKAVGDLLQKREPGDKTASPTPPTAPDGETFNQVGTPIKSTTTIGPTTINTTTTNYQTGNGTDARPGTGTGTGDGGDGGDDGNDNAVGGNGDCETGWLPSGDAILSALLGEAHKTRCQGERDAGNAGTDADTLGAAADALEGESGSIWGNGASGDGLSETWFSFGGGACPIDDFSVTVKDITIAAPQQLCDLGAALGTLFILIAYAWALRIVVA